MAANTTATKRTAIPYPRLFPPPTRWTVTTDEGGRLPGRPPRPRFHRSVRFLSIPGRALAISVRQGGMVGPAVALDLADLTLDRGDHLGMAHLEAEAALD